jgi:hypothetical protein
VTNKDLIFVFLQVGALLIAGIVAYFGFVVRVEKRLESVDMRCAQHTETLDRVKTMHTELEKVKSENALFWKVIEPHIAKIIHSPVHKSRDELVDKFIHDQLSLPEAMKLKEQLCEALESPDWSNEKRLAAALLLTRVLLITRDAYPPC